MQDFGCVLSEYEGKLRPIFYIKLELWFKILELNEKTPEKIYEFLKDDETYILNISDMGLPATPIQKSVLQELLNDSYDIEKLNIEELSQKYNLTKEYLEETVEFLKKEVKKMSFDLILYEVKNMSNNDDKNSSESDSDSDSDSDNYK